MSWPLAITLVGVTFSLALMIVGVAWAGRGK
jgi:hypothetical protein